MELRLYTLVKARLCSLTELKNCYTLDEALKLYALHVRDLDIERGRMREAEEGRNRR